MQEILAVFGVNWKLLVIQIVNFGVLLLVLWRFLYRPVLSMIESRREKLERGVRDAEEAERKLAQIEEDKSEIIKKSLREGEAVVKEAKRRAEDQGKMIVEDAHERSAKAAAEARKAAENERARMLAGAEREIARIAVLGAEKILRERS